MRLERDATRSTTHHDLDVAVTRGARPHKAQIVERGSLRVADRYQRNVSKVTE
jgi:hypothetical protein